MKKVILLIAFATVAFSATRISIGELFGSHTCPACRNAHSYLSAFADMFEDSAAVLEFHLDDGLEISGVTSRYLFYDDYYEMGYIPHMFINGENDSSLLYTWMGRMTTDAREESYVGIEVVEHLFESVGFRIYIDDSLAEEAGIESEEDYTIIAVLTRHGVPYEDTVYNWVVSKFYTDPNGEIYTLAPGDTIELGWDFDIEPDWNPALCNFVIYVVGPELPYILNGYELLVFRRDDYDFRTIETITKSLIMVDDTASLSAKMVNFGELEDTYQLSIEEISVPDDWEIVFTEAGVDTSFELPPLDTGTIDISVVANSPGIARFAILFHTEELAERYDTVYYKVAAGIENLIVNDSWTPDSARFIEFFDERDELSFYWQTESDGELPDFSTMGIERIFWYCGEESGSCLSPHHRSQLVNYVTSTNGKLFLSGSGIGRRASSDAAFYRIALGAMYEGIVEDIASVSAIGEIVPFSGWTGSFSGVSYGESVSGFSTFGGITAFEYDDGSPAGIVKESGEARLVYIGFPANSFISHTTFESLIDNAIEFLDEGAYISEKYKSPRNPNISVSPNPFNSSCEIKYSIQAGNISIVDISGREIFNSAVSGVGNILWDTSEQASGIYFVRLKSDDVKMEKKILLIK
ncbi:hypothetical protein DRQ33_03225 [bacterium]|nr:MAG: hypothetical protein DRQ33_03225 [bacterium]